jgi:hypothetical protein
MATTQNQPGRKTISMPATARNTRASLKAGEAPKKTSRTRTLEKKTENIWVNALQNAGGFHRDALQLELSVGLSLFAAKADENKVALPAKRALREIYAQAGYACSTPTGEDYKTVARRINVAADLYAHLGGRETVVDWIEDAQGSAQIDAIMEHVKAMKFDGINSVLAYVGKAVAVKRPRMHHAAPTTGTGAPEGDAANQGQMSEEDRRAAEAIAAQMTGEPGTRRASDKLPPGRVFTHGQMSVAIPFDATFEDVVALASDLMAFANAHMKLAA